MQEKIIQTLLQDGETVLWSDVPKPWPLTLPSLVIYVFAVPWTIFSFLWLYLVTDGLHWLPPAVPPYPAWTPRFFAGIAVLALVPGVVMLTAPYWAWRKALRTVYVVTDRRVLQIDQAKPGKMQSLELDGQVVMRVKDPSAEVSDLEFGVGEKGMILRAVPQAGKVVEILRSARLAQN